MNLSQLYPNQEDIQIITLLDDCDPPQTERLIGPERKLVQNLTSVLPELSEEQIDFDRKFSDQGPKQVTIYGVLEESKPKARIICSVTQKLYFRGVDVKFLIV